MYGSPSPTSRKTIPGLPIRNIDYGNLHKSLRVSEKDDVKRKLEPDFLHDLGNMCIKATSHGGMRGGKTGGYHGNAISCQDMDRIKRNTVTDTTLNTSRNRSPSPHINSGTPGPVGTTQPTTGYHPGHEVVPGKPHHTSYCGICRKNEGDMTHYGIYHQDDTVDLVMGSVIERIDHLIDRLGKGGYDKLQEKAIQDKENIGFSLPCEACTIRSKKRFSEIACQTEEIYQPVLADDLEVEDIEIQSNLQQPSLDEVTSRSEADSSLPPHSPIKQKTSPQKESKLKDSSFDKDGVYSDDESNLSSDDEFSLDTEKLLEEEEVDPQEVQEYKIAAAQRQEIPEAGTSETVHFRMVPYKNLVVMGSRKYVGLLPPRIALKTNYDLSYHITVFKTLTSDRTDIRLKKLKELVTARGGKGSSPKRSPGGRAVDSSRLANIMVVDIARYSRMRKNRGGVDKRIPVVNLRDGYNNRLFLSERVSEIMLSRSPRLRFALELAKSNRAHWKANAKDLSTNNRPYQSPVLYSGKPHAQFYLAEMKKFVTKPLHSRCIVYYADLYEDNTKDHVKSKTFVSCLGNITSKDSKATPTMNLEERIKEHLRAGQKLHDPKVNIFNVALQNPILGLEEPGKFVPRKEAMKGCTEITKCPNLLFVPLDFGYSSWSKPTTPDHLSPLKQAYCDVFVSNGPAGYNV